MSKNFGENYSKRLNLRLSEEQFNYLILLSGNNNMSPSNYIRTVLDVLITNYKKGENDCLENNKNGFYY